MELETLRAVCRALPGTTEDVKWGADLCFCVGEKMYAVWGLDEGGLGFKAEPLEYARLIGIDGVEPSAYLARYNWVSLKAPHALSDAELADLVRTSHALVAARLPRKLRVSLGIP